MRKHIMAGVHNKAALSDGDWLAVEELAEVELTSEDTAHPIESALRRVEDPGWRAGAPGRQTIRLLFDHPQPVRRICLQFEEPAIERTQEYVLRWSPDGGRSFQDIVRQQWNFSPPHTTNETEDHRVDLPAVTALELEIIPDISGGSAYASLARLRLA